MAERVALFTGAWIETASRRASTPGASVALFTGAWIETLRYYGVMEKLAVASPSSRGRGLKPCRDGRGDLGTGSPSSRGRGLKHVDGGAASQPEVALFTGAWIETPGDSARHVGRESPSSRGRGLKHFMVGSKKIDIGRPLHGGVD